MLPKPHGSFTLPSVHDDLELQCRIYFPRRSNEERKRFVSGFAIFAHPYAPLGGSYDDPVVHICGSSLLKQGFILTTFNFRGAENSAGRTSWSGKAELGDYVSVAAFLLSFINFPSLAEHLQPDNAPPWLLFGGYSYGSLIASHLPDIEVVRQLLITALPGSAAHEINARAQDLAQSFLGYAESAPSRGRAVFRSSDAANPANLVVSIGGYESEAAGRRISRESSRRSIDVEKVRQSVDRVRQKFNQRSASGQEPNIGCADSERIDISLIPRAAFLLVSPLLGAVSGFTTIFQKLEFKLPPTPTPNPAANLNSFSRHPTCIVYGDDDAFTSSRKLQNWCSELKSRPGALVTSYEINGAGHFWREEQHQRELINAIQSWLASTLS